MPIVTGGLLFPLGLEQGITRRDWLAGLAMQAIITEQVTIDELRAEKTGEMEKVCQMVSNAAYQFADCVIARGQE